MAKKISENDIERKLKALSDPKRLKIVELLKEKDMFACNLLESFDVTQPTMSHDMHILTASGLVTGSRKGRWMNYSLNYDGLNELIKALQAIAEK